MPRRLLPCRYISTWNMCRNGLLELTQSSMAVHMALFSSLHARA